MGEIYDVTQAISHAPVTLEELQKALRPEEEDKNKEKEKNESSIEVSVKEKKPEVQRDQKAPMTKKEKRRLKEMKLKQEQKAKEEEQKKQQDNNKKQKERNIKNITLLRCIKEKFSEKYGPSLVDHIIKKSGLNPSLKVFTEFDISPESPQMQNLFKAFNEADEIVNSINTNQNKGYIITHKMGGEGKKNNENTIANEETTDKEGETEKTENIIYDEFHPYLFTQFEERVKDVIIFPSFNEAVDEYYSKLEAQQIELKKKNTENAAQKKLDNVRKVQEDRIKGLEETCERSIEMAQAIEANQDYVDQLIQLIRSFLASGMDWVDLENMLAEERKRNNPVAIAIKELKFINGMVSVELLSPEYLYNMEDSDDDDDSDDDSDDESNESESDETKSEKSEKKKEKKVKKSIIVDIDIYSSAYANARRYYDMKRSASAKQEKTIQAAEKALKSAEKKIAKEMNITKMPLAPSIVKVRKPYWFEKFHWFISSENYLVLAGRDALQNEQLVRKYLRKGDIYIHADIHGASTVIVKNTNPMGETKATIASGECPIPPTTLLQAATMAVCYSKAWDSKVVTSAYWVFDHQVSKTAPSGEYLTTGSFMIRGKKNWLPVVQLVYGFGFLFRIEDSNIPRHYWERRPWGRDSDETDEAISKKIALKREKQREALLSLHNVEDVDDEDDEGEDEEKKESIKKPENKNENENENENEIVNSDDVKEESQVNKNSEEENSNDDDNEEDEDDKSESKEEEEDKSESKKDNEEDEEGEEDNEDNEDNEGNGDDEDDEDEDFEFPDTQIEAPQLLSEKKQKDKKMMDDIKQRYNLNEIEHEEEIDETVENLQSSGRKHISATERRQLRRKKRQEKRMNKLLEASEDGVSTPNDSTNEFTSDGTNEGKRKKKGKNKGGNSNNSNSVINKFMTSDSTVTSILQSNVRGKKGKIKKLKEKYLNQDDEERRIRMQLTGALNKKEMKKGKKGKKENQNQKALAFMSSANNSKSNNSKKGNNNNNNSNNKKSSTTAQQEKEEIQQILKDENIPILEEEQLESLMMLDELTGQPNAEDELLYAIPVCAPWTCLQKYKYRVKLLPGGVKKGKLVRSITSNFVQMSNALDREKELLMSVHENEMIGTIGLSKCEMVNENSSIGGTKKRNKRSK